MASKFITISIDIMHDKNLTPNQKFILAEIHQLSSLKKGCVASNRHFSELIGITMSGVSKAISDLEEKGYIHINNSQTKRNIGRVITIEDSQGGIDCGKSGIDCSQESKENITINIQENIKNTKKDFDLENSKEGLVPEIKAKDLITFYKENISKLQSKIKEVASVNAIALCSDDMSKILIGLDNYSKDLPKDKLYITNLEKFVKEKIYLDYQENIKRNVPQNTFNISDKKYSESEKF